MKFTKIIKNNLGYLIVIFLLSLTPLLWFQPGQLLTGTDVDFPLFPQERFESRSQVWDTGVIGGSDRSNNTASLVVVGGQALLEKAGLDIISVEKITYVFWFLLTGLAMYFLMTIVLGDETRWSRVAKFSGTLIYMFNFYIAFVWQRLQMETTVLVLFPIYLGFMIALNRKIINIPISVLILTIITIICGAIGIQPPLITIMFAMLFLYALYYSFEQFYKKQWKNITKIFGVYTLLIVVFLLASGYWIIPEINFIVSSSYGSASVGKEVYSVHSLIEWVSQPTSFANVFRFLGDVAMLDSWGGEFYSPEFQAYLTNPILIFASFIIPALVFSILLFYRKIKDKIFLFFVVLTLIGLFLSKGIHSPLGGLYSWMVDNVPLFWIQRAPWQKFTMVTVLGYSVLGGISVGYIYKYIRNRHFKYIFVIVFAIFIVSYNYYTTLGQVFPSKDAETGFHGEFNLGFHHKFPEYIFEAKKWMDPKEEYFKIGLLPDDRAIVYNWGYAGSTSLASLLFDKGLVSRQYGEGFAPPNSSEEVMKIFIKALYRDEFTTEVKDILNLLGIEYLLQRNDFNYDFYGDNDSPEFIKKQLSKHKGIELEKTFGEWDFYKVESDQPFLYVPKNTIRIINSDINLLMPLLKNKLFRDLEDPVLIFGNEADASTFQMNIIPNIDVMKVSSRVVVPAIDSTPESFSWESRSNEGLVVKGEFYEGVQTIVSIDDEKGSHPLIPYGSAGLPNGLYKPTVEVFNPTLIYVETGKNGVIVDDIFTNKENIKTNIEKVWFKNKVLSRKDGIWTSPLHIESNTKIILQVNGRIDEDATIIFIEDTDLNTPEVTEVSFPILRPAESLFDWTRKELEGNTELITSAIYYGGSKELISDNGEGDPDLFIFESPEEVPYKMYNGSTSWFAYNSTILYMKTGDKPFTLSKLYAEDGQALKIVGAWWETGFFGAGGEKVTLPFKFPANQKIIIQIDFKVDGQLNMDYIPEKIGHEFTNNNDQKVPTLEFKRISPTKYKVKIRAASEPFILVIKENFDKNWKAYLDYPEEDGFTSSFSETWLKKAISEDNHIVANGYANSWILDIEKIKKTGQYKANEDGTIDFELTIEFWPQQLFYIGLMVSSLTLLSSISYFLLSRRRKPKIQ